MKSLLRHFQGDIAIWILTFILSFVSLLAVYSASSNLAFVYRNGNVLAMVLKHAVMIVFGFGLMYVVHKLPYRYFSALSLIALPLALLLLVLTLAQGNSIGGANASRWLEIPYLGVSFQPSAFAMVSLMMYLARYLTRNNVREMTFSETLLYGIGPIVLVCILVLPANFSTAALIFVMSTILLFVGGYPVKNLLKLFGVGLVGLGLFILTVKAFPNISNRVDTWVSRVEAFTTGDADPSKNYQVQKAKMAIASGHLLGKGPGKSMQKNFLPQSNSDFIYAIIVEEYGLIFGGIITLLAYVIFFVRLMSLITKTKDSFGQLLALGAGMGILLQATINMGVAVNLFPVTGQTLPLVSAGGTSIWIAFFSIGVVLSVSKALQEDSESQEEAEPKAETPDENPLNPVLHEA
ncbi:MAG: FtsW/RodA/SpoVE family cell cycle protein [Schleiferiaceae bacterium]|nr:FtsW/RodA/SpoVE family cell cycle protein [Schleiferiaceae bacterium]